MLKTRCTNEVEVHYNYIIIFRLIELSYQYLYLIGSYVTITSFYVLCNET